MSKGHRDNVVARRKRGERAYVKRRNRRQRKYIGPWSVGFSCGTTDYHPSAGSDEISNLASKSHNCEAKECEPTHFERLA